MNQLNIEVSRSNTLQIEVEEPKLGDREDNYVWVGGSVHLKFSFTVEDPNTGVATPTDPATVTLTVTDPSGNDTSPAVNKITTGEWDVDIPVNASSQWWWRLVTTSPQGVREGSFDVRASKVS